MEIQANAAHTDEKLIATLQARAALAGAQLIKIDADNGSPELLLIRGAETRRFQDVQMACAVIGR